MKPSFIDTTVNYLILLGFLILLTAAINVTFGVRLELYHTAPFMALWCAVRHSPPPFKDY